MDGFDDFETVFGSNTNVAYEKAVADDVKKRRQSLENELFIDRLLKALGVQKVSELYPAESHKNLRLLHEQIISSSSPDHHKHSALYYLLKDFHKHSHQSPRDFANSSYLPGKYKTFIDGIWQLDRLEFEKALDYLTEPALIPTFPEEILYTLCRHAPNATLPVAYYQTVSPAITSGRVLETYLLTLCRISVTEAFYFSRTQGDLNHRVLFEKLINFVLENALGVKKATRGVELISLPLDKEEESWFTNFLKDGKGRNLAGANDTLIMRAISIGQSESVSQDRRKGNSQKIDGVDWHTLRAACSTFSENSSEIGSPDESVGPGLLNITNGAAKQSNKVVILSDGDLRRFFGEQWLYHVVTASRLRQKKGISSTPAKRAKAVAQAVTGIEYSSIFSQEFSRLASHESLLHAISRL